MRNQRNHDGSTESGGINRIIMNEQDHDESTES